MNLYAFIKNIIDSKFKSDLRDENIKKIKTYDIVDNTCKDIPYRLGRSAKNIIKYEVEPIFTPLPLDYGKNVKK